jgi:hypothetical protein
LQRNLITVTQGTKMQQLKLAMQCLIAAMLRLRFGFVCVCHNNAAAWPTVSPALPNAGEERQQVPSIAGVTPSLLLPALEAGLRCLAANGADGAVFGAAHHTGWVGAAAHDSCSVRQQPVGIRTEQRQQQRLQQQLHALHVTHLKCVLKNVARVRPAAAAAAAGGLQGLELSRSSRFEEGWEHRGRSREQLQGIAGAPHGQQQQQQQAD